MKRLGSRSSSGFEFTIALHLRTEDPPSFALPNHLEGSILVAKHDTPKVAVHAVIPIT